MSKVVEMFKESWAPTIYKAENGYLVSMENKEGEINTYIFSRWDQVTSFLEGFLA